MRNQLCMRALQKVLRVSDSPNYDCYKFVDLYILDSLLICDNVACVILSELVHDCSVNNVPFPALETFEDRKMFPKRYFLFFDIFVRAGRHNRDLWKKAIRENKGANDMRFGPAIFEAHVRTTVRENYFKWIFQQLSDVHEVEDDDVKSFQIEYDEHVYSDLPRTLVCTHKELTRFPFKSFEIGYGETCNTNEREASEEEDDYDSYCSANSSIGRATTTATATTSPNPAAEDGASPKRFFLVNKKVDNNLFNDIREQQRRDIKSVIEKAREQHKAVLETLRETILKTREVKKTLQDTDPMYKAAVADAKKSLRLFKDPYEEDTEGPYRKKRRKSIENQTRFSDSKVTFFSKANEDMKREEKEGLRKSWEQMYKEVWNTHLLVPKTPVIDIPMPQVDSIVRDMESDVNQLLADCAGMVEQV